MSEIVNEKIQPENSDTYEGISPAGYTYGGSPNRNTPFWVKSATEDTYIKDITFSEETSTTETKYKETATNNLGQTVSQTIVVPVGGGGGVTPDITATASVDETTGTPAVSVTKSGTDTNPNFDFAFSGIKGEKGEKGEKGAQGEQGPQGETGATGKTPSVQASAVIMGSTGTPSVDVIRSGGDDMPIFMFQFSNLKGEKGDQGPAGPGGDITVTAETSYSEDTEYGTTPEVEVTKADDNINLNFKDFNRHETIGESSTEGKAVITIGNGRQGSLKAKETASYLAPGSSKLKTLRTGISFECDDGNATSTADVQLPVSVLTGITSYTTTERKYQADGNRINFENVKTLSDGTYTALTEPAFRFGNTSNGASLTSDFVDLTVGTVSVPYYLGKPLSFDGCGNVSYLSPFDGETVERTVALGAGGGTSFTEFVIGPITSVYADSNITGDCYNLLLRCIVKTDSGTSFLNFYGIAKYTGSSWEYVTPVLIKGNLGSGFGYVTSGSIGYGYTITVKALGSFDTYNSISPDVLSVRNIVSKDNITSLALEMADSTYVGPTTGSGTAVCTLTLVGLVDTDSVVCTLAAPYYYDSSTTSLYITSDFIVSSFSTAGNAYKGELSFSGTFSNPYTSGIMLRLKTESGSKFSPQSATIAINKW